MLSGGILRLALDDTRQGSFCLKGTIRDLCNAVVIMGYTLADGLGARASGDAISYVCWIFFLNTFPINIILSVKYGKTFFAYVGQRWKYGLLGGLCSLGAYGVTIWAMAEAPIALVAALRETSVIFGLLMAVIFLKEKASPLRVLSVLLVAGGAICMKVLA